MHEEKCFGLVSKETAKRVNGWGRVSQGHAATTDNSCVWSLLGLPLQAEGTDRTVWGENLNWQMWASVLQSGEKLFQIVLLP